MEIIVTALLSTVLTLGLAFWGGRFILINRLEPVIRALVDDRLEELGALIEERVRLGVVSAVEDVTSTKNLQRTMTRNQNDLLDAIFGSRS